MQRKWQRRWRRLAKTILPPRKNIVGRGLVRAGHRLRGMAAAAALAGLLVFLPAGAAQAAIGTTTITGDYAPASGSTMTVEISPTASDELVVSGTATLSNVTLSLQFDSGAYTNGTSYTIVSAGTLSTNYVTVTGTLTGYFYTTTTSGTNLIITIYNLASAAGTANQQAVAAALDGVATSATGDLSTVITSVSNLSTAADRRNAYDQMGGLVHTALTGAAASAGNQYIATVANRMTGFITAAPSLTAGGGGGAAGQAKNGGAPWSCWTSGYGNWGDRHGTDAASRYDYRTSGATLGFDRKLSDKWLVGAAAGQSSTRVTMNGLAGSGRVKSTQTALYGSWLNGPWYVNTVAAYGNNNYTATRHLAFGAIDRTARAGYGGDSLSGYTEAGYRIKRGSLYIIPMAALQTGRYARDGFSESGADSLDLNVEKARASSLTGSLGVRVRKDVPTAAGMLTGEFTARWLHDFRSLDSSVSASLAGDSAAAFTVAGDQCKDSANLGLGLTWKTRRNTNWFLSYDANLARDGSEQRLTLGMRRTW